MDKLKNPNRTKGYMGWGLGGRDVHIPHPNLYSPVCNIVPNLYLYTIGVSITFYCSFSFLSLPI